MAPFSFHAVRLGGCFWPEAEHWTGLIAKEYQQQLALLLCNQAIKSAVIECDSQQQILP